MSERMGQNFTNGKKKNVESMNVYFYSKQKKKVKTNKQNKQKQNKTNRTDKIIIISIHFFLLITYNIYI